MKSTGDPSDRGGSTSLVPLFQPASIAVFGVGPSETTFAGRAYQALSRFHFTGDLYAINPNHQEVYGRRCYGSIGEIPRSVDLAIVATQAQHVLAIVEECAAAGVKSILVHSAGFNEVGDSGAQMQMDLSRLSDETGIRILGPNCLGFYNLDVATNPVVATPSSLVERLNTDTVGDVSFITQSGGMGSGAVGEAARVGITFRHFIHTGNEADITVADCLGYLSGVSAVNVVCLFLEQVRQPAIFAESIHQLRRSGKDVIAVVAGSSQAGARATKSHTGAIAGDGAVVTSYLRQLGVVVVEDLDEMLDAAVLAQARLRASGPRVGILTASGGAGAVLADLLVERRLDVPSLGETTKERLARVLPDFGESQNPVDLTGQILAQPGTLAGAAEAMLESTDVDSVVVVLGVLDMHASRWAEDIRWLASQHSKPITVCWLGALPSTLEVLREHGVPVFTSLARVARSMDILGALASAREAPLVRPAQPGGLSVDPALLVWRGEYAAKELLKDAGIAVPRGHLVHDAADAKSIALDIGYPVVAKIHDPTQLHKSDIGGVRVDIRDADELESHVNELLALQSDASEGPVEILIEQYSRLSTELIVGAWNDAAFGPVLMVGSGGVFTEAATDHQVAVLPVTSGEIRAMLRRLHIYPVLKGIRGIPPVDMDELVDVISRFSVLATTALENGISEMEINPLGVSKDGGVVALDVLLVQGAGRVPGSMIGE